MQLQYIKQESCPICGNTTIVKEWIETDCRNNLEIREHAHGGVWEHRLFACGQELEYVPNFSSVEICKRHNICTNNDEYKQKIKKREDVKKQLIDFIDTLDIDDTIKKSWQNSIY